MAASTKYTPGVYVEEISTFPPSIVAVQTAVPAFIGYTEKAIFEGKDVTGKPMRLTSLIEYVEIFGRAQNEENMIVTIAPDSNGKMVYSVDYDKTDGKGLSKHVMYYAMQQFFVNGGGPCYIISVGSYLSPFGAPLADQTVFDKALGELEKQDEPTMIIFPEGQNMPKDNYFSLLQTALAQCSKLKDRFVIMDLQHSGIGLSSISLKTETDLFRASIGDDAELLRFGAAYFPNIRSSFDYQVDPAAAKVLKNGQDTPFGTLNGLEKANVKLALANYSIYLPPSASVAGVYTRVDNTRGVFKAPANESLRSVFELTFDINDDIQENLNVDVNTGKSINAIRAFSLRGVKIWGARTLDGNSNEWRYVSVRRYFNMVEESTKKATEQFVFEPNSANTWIQVKGMIENFLVNEWRAGALVGAKPEHAFFVHVGLNQTMTAQDILEGYMIVEIGLAVVRPAEFIILRFSHKMQES